MSGHWRFGTATSLSSKTPDPQNNHDDLGMGQNLVPLVNIKIAGKWMFIPLKMVSIGIDPYPFQAIPNSY